MRHTTKVGAVVLACAAMFAAGCGSDDDSSSDTGSSSQGSAYGGGGEEAAATGTAVAMKDIQFNPKDLTVNAGDTVTWTNDDAVDHNVVAEEGADFKSDNFGEGGTYKFKTEDAGVIKYTCTLHSGMDGTLTVK